jgi:hypothetical protein
MSLPPQSQRRRLQGFLTDLAGSIEDLMSSGLSTASAATLERLDVGFREASQQRLMRVGSTLRIVNEEIRRYLDEDSSFSSRRLAFFLNRAWLLSRSLARALADADESAWQGLLLTPAPRPLPAFTAIALGVAKKVAVNVFCAFDFRLRILELEASAEPDLLPVDSDALHTMPLVWSAIFPVKNPEIPAEAYLQLQQPQKFYPGMLLKKPVRIEGGAISRGSGSPRLLLGPDSQVKEADLAVANLDHFCSWDRAATGQRLRNHRASPLDLDVELEEEIVLHDWRLGKREPERLGDRHVYPLTAAGVEYSAVVTDGVEGEALNDTLARLHRQPERSPLFALLHCELGRLIVRPLSLLGGKWPIHLALSDSKVGTQELLKMFKFTN